MSTTTGTTTPTSTTASNPVIAITYASNVVLEPESGNYLLVDMTIENRGYAVFNTSPSYFRASINNATFTYDAARTTLAVMDLPEGGTLTGRVTFQVPLGAGSGKVTVTLAYYGVQIYNVQFFASP
jgi:hypothetical protein